MGARWHVYLLECGDGSLYCGVAVDVAARVRQHERGKGARYTRGRGPLRLVCRYRCPSRGDALRLEIAVKALDRASKLRLASRPSRLGELARRLRARRADRAP